MSQSLTSNAAATRKQALRVGQLTSEALKGVLDKMSETFSQAELQAVHENGGQYKQELAAAFGPNLLEFIHVFVRKVLGLVTPLRARKTGLISDDLCVWFKGRDEQDFPEGELLLSNLTAELLIGGEVWIHGDEVLQRAEAAGAIGSLGFAKVVLDLQREGGNIPALDVVAIGSYIILPRTIMREHGDPNGYGVYILIPRNLGGWKLSFRWLESGFPPGGYILKLREPESAVQQP